MYTFTPLIGVVFPIFIFSCIDMGVFSIVAIFIGLVLSILWFIKTVLVFCFTHETGYPTVIFANLISTAIVLIPLVVIGVLLSILQ